MVLHARMLRPKIVIISPIVDMFVELVGLLQIMTLLHNHDAEQRIKEGASERLTDSKGYVHR